MLIKFVKFVKFDMFVKFNIFIAEKACKGTTFFYMSQVFVKKRYIFISLFA